MDEEVRDSDCLVGMKCCFFVFVDLREQSTDLHMRFAFVFQHLQLKRRLVGVVEEVLHKVLRQMRQAMLQRHSTLLQHSQLLIT